MGRSRSLPSRTATRSVSRSSPGAGHRFCGKAFHVCGELGARDDGFRLLLGSPVELVHLDDRLRPRAEQVAVRLRPAEQLGDDEDRQRFGEVGDARRRPSAEMVGAVVEQPGGQLLDPGPRRDTWPRLNALCTSRRSRVCFGGSLSRIESACSQLNVSHSWSGSRGRKIRPSARSRRTWLQAAWLVATQIPRPLVPGDRRLGPEGGEGGVRVGDDVGVRQVQQLGGVHGDHDASVGSGAATCRGSSWSPVLRAAMGRSAHSASSRNGHRGR